MEYIELKDACFSLDKEIIEKTKLIENGKYEVINSARGIYGYYDKYNNLGDAITIASRGEYAGFTNYMQKPFFAGALCYPYRSKIKELKTKFLYYFLKSKEEYIMKNIVVRGSIPALNKVDFDKMKIPIPPLKLQEDIIEKLDKFTEYIALLNEELSLRRKQYEYYRNELLTFGDEIERRELIEVFNLRNGYTPSTKNEEFWENGTISWFKMEDLKKNKRALKKANNKINEKAIKGKGLFKKNSILLATTATIGIHAMLTEDALANQQFTNFELKEEYKDRLIPEFIYYYFFEIDKWCLKNQKVSSFPSVDMEKLKKLKFPIPPLEKQQKIADILDRYTKSNDELINNLKKEYELRVKQYEYYRDELLTFGDDVAKFNFGQITTVLRGASPRPINKYITTDENGVNWIKIGDVNPSDKYVLKSKEKITMEGAFRSRKVKKGDFIISNSMSFGRPYILKIDGCVHDGWLIIKDFEKVLNPDFLYYTLTSSEIQKKLDELVPKGTIRNLNADIIKSLEIFVPPLEKQKEIVNILDKFESMNNEVRKNILAEIEIIEKQYSYYMDMMFSFNKK